MTRPTSSVLIPSFGRPEKLAECLKRLGNQTVPPGEVLVVWQTDDTATRAAAERFAATSPVPIRILHSPEAGIVPAENLALEAASGEIILLIDDDAYAPPDWVARHLAHYDDPSVGAVGGPAVNFRSDGTPFPKRAVEPVGRLHWQGRFYANMYDHVPEWRNRPPREVDHLVGYNMSLRRSAFDQFEAGLRRYWQLFEMEACLQVKGRGYRVLFDFANAVEHWPSNTAYIPDRDGDLQVKVYNSAYNQAFILAKHSGFGLRSIRWLYLLAVGSVTTPGVVGSLLAMRRFGQPLRELKILGGTWRHRLAGWQAGTRSRRGRIAVENGSAGERR